VSYVKLDIENLKEAGKKIRKALLKQEESIIKIKDTLKTCRAGARKSRKLFAVDSGFNSAYETPFTVFKAAVVNGDMEVDYSSSIYLFHVNSYQTDRFRRFLMQYTLYEVLAKTINTGVADGSIVLVDGTITLSIFYPTVKDSKEYKEHFKNFYKEVYSPLMNKCIKNDVILLGFLKRTGSTYLAGHLGAKGLYDIYIMHSALQSNGQYIKPVPVIDTQARRVGIHHNYVTFYLNLKNWKYRFELLKQQQNQFLECIENLLFWATEAHYGMNPVFSKADEYARVTKREANLIFNYIIHGLSEDEQIRLRMEARKRTHFGYKSRSIPQRLT
jgi:hypothetical protein